MRKLIDIAIQTYRRTPLYPSWNKRLGKVLASVNGHGIKHAWPVRSFRMNLDLAQHIDSKIYYTGAFEPESVTLLERELRPGMVAVDVGANIGFLSLIMAEIVGETGKVFAFEPSDWTFDRLTANIAINPKYQIAAYHLAVSDKPEDAAILRLPCGYRLDGTDTSTVQTVQIETLDRFFETNPIRRLDFIKTDTDGFEPNVLKGAAHTIAAFKPLIFFEVSPTHMEKVGNTVASLFDPLSDLGYEFFTDGDGSRSVDPRKEAMRASPLASINLLAKNVQRD